MSFNSHVAFFPLTSLGRLAVYYVLVCVYHSADGLTCDVKHGLRDDCTLLPRPGLSVGFTGRSAS